jgi:predicted DNA binding CopG/RHH family protein
MPLTNNAPRVGGSGDEMVGKSKDPKGTRITVRISEKDLQDLQGEARRRGITVGAVVRYLIRERLHVAEAGVSTSG